MKAHLLVVLLAAALSACGSDTDDVAAGLPDAEVTYDGPLHVAEGRYGAAGQVVDCRHGARLGGFERAEVYSEGATSDTVKGALETARSEGMFLEIPQVDLAVSKTERDRVLLTYVDDDGATKIAIVFHDGKGSEGAGGDGWYRESWARCDLSEFPEQVAESFYGHQIWTDSDGAPALTSKIVSFPGAEHCGWQETTFLSLGESRRGDNLYARDPQPDIAEYMQGRYRAAIELPDGAVATPYSRDGKRLWLSADKRYAYVGEPGSVEAWPRARPGFGCA